jgi:hypothetical protein
MTNVPIKNDADPFISSKAFVAPARITRAKDKGRMLAHPPLVYSLR